MGVGFYWENFILECIKSVFKLGMNLYYKSKITHCLYSIVRET